MAFEGISAGGNVDVENHDVVSFVRPVEPRGVKWFFCLAAALVVSIVILLFSGPPTQTALNALSPEDRAIATAISSKGVCSSPLMKVESFETTAPGHWVITCGLTAFAVPRITVGAFCLEGQFAVAGYSEYSFYGTCPASAS